MTDKVESPRAPLFSRRQLAMLLLPFVAEQALGLMVGLTDTLMISSMGEAAVSGVSLVDSVNTLIIELFSALSAGGAVIASQFIGRRDDADARKSAAQVLIVLAIFSSVVAVVCLLLHRSILSLAFGSILPEVMHNAQVYFLISALSYPFLALYNAGAALFRAQGNSRISLLSSAVMNAINIAGNAWLIYGMHWGVAGAALASLAARAFSCILVLALLQRIGSPLRVSSREEWKPDLRLIRKILYIGIPSGIEGSLFQFGKLCLSHLTSTLGTAAIAANAVANNVSSILCIPAGAVGMAAVAVVGQCIGAGERRQARQYSRLLLALAWAGAITMNLLSLVFSKYVIGWFHLSQDASVQCIAILRWFSVASILFWPLSFTVPHFLHAAGDVRYPMAVSIGSMWLCRIGFSFLMVKYFQIGLLGVWLGMFLDWVVRGTLFTARFAGKKWLEKRII